MIVPKPFQRPYIENILAHFRVARDHHAASTDGLQHRAVFAADGAVLLKAPTGSGKTLMAGTVAETLARETGVVWFWFAPFTGLVGQSAASLRDHHPGLRVRDLANQRRASTVKAGDTYVLTWASLVAANTEARVMRQDRENAPAFDSFLEAIRARGLEIGVIIDEAHHGMKAGTQATAFFRDVLAPHYCLMITATPDDQDAEKFRREAGILRLHPVVMPRDEAVEAGLLKPDVKSIAYLSPPDQAVLADFETAALQDAVRTHNRIKDELKAQGIDLVPLLMVQAESGPQSVRNTKEKLVKLGIPESAIRTHEAKEPDENFLSTAVDETKEALVFKMAAAQGFDAPRAFVLASMRPVKDADFGTQLIGRILRVHRRLQGRELPPILRSGYLFLADADSQSGIKAAADKINQLRSQISECSPLTMLVQVGDQKGVQLVTGGQTQMWPAFPTGADGKADGGTAGSVPDPTEQDLIGFLLDGPSSAPAPDQPQGAGGRGEGGGAGIPAGYRYALKPEAPRRFLRQDLPLEMDGLVECIGQQVKFDDGKLLGALAEEVQVIRVERTHFVSAPETERREVIQARIDMERTQEQAQALLFGHGTLDPRDLQDRLLQRLAQEFRQHGFSAVADDPDRLEDALAILLVRSPRLLHEVEKQCGARFATTGEAASLPDSLLSSTSLDPSFKNVYGVFPVDLNGWEREFAKLLDNDPTGSVLWWHRNPPRKPWSVSITRPDGGLFFPDFVVGVRDRKFSKDGVLLVETKNFISSIDSQVKAAAEHKDYGRAVMLHRRSAGEWMTVRYNAQMGKNELDAVFRLDAMATY